MTDANVLGIGGDFDRPRTMVDAASNATRRRFAGMQVRRPFGLRNRFRD